MPFLAAIRAAAAAGAMLSCSVPACQYAPPESGPEQSSATAYECDASDAASVVRTVRPGHYVSLTRNDNLATVARTEMPGVVGIQKRYTWRELEPERGQYQFGDLRADLDALLAADLSLVVFIQDKTFGGGNPMPGYLEAMALPNRPNGFTAMRWHPEVVDRMTALLRALGAAFDCHPAFEGIALQESALGLDESPRRKNGYRAERYRDALIEILQAAADALPRSQVFWYMNYLPGGNRYLVEIAQKAADAGIAMGGPDILPDSGPLSRLVYPMYGRFQGRMTLFGSMQNDSFAHPRLDGRAEGYWSLDDLYHFARNDLHVDYIFWNRKTWRDPADSYAFEDALEVIRQTADFSARKESK